ncbi:MAG: hypothetical protein FJ211_08605 [Ignavibacteria bacterium]|nr:hypothetical protein [Ignavibacteria bacterium]
MKSLLHAVVYCTLLLARVTLLAQSEASDYARIGHAGFLSTVVTDYQCVGINPANLGFVPQRDVYSFSTPLTSGSEYSRKTFSVGLGEGGASIRSDALSKSGMIDILLQRGSAVKFTEEDKREAARVFAGKGLRFNIDIMPFAIAYQHETVGGIAMSVRERINGTFVLNEQAAKLMFQGRHSDYFDSTALNWRGDTIGYARNPQPFSKLFDGTILSMSWLREYAVSYGLQLYSDDNLALYMGVSPKIFQSYAYLEARVSAGNLLAQSALSPYFAINYGKATTPSAIGGTALVPIGTGYGLDAGITVQYHEWTFSGSVIDIGTITYNGNVFAASDTVLNGLGSEGFDSYNLFEEAPKITGEGQYFRWNGLLSAKADLPIRLRFGSSWQQNKRWTYGIDCIIALNDVAGSLQQNLFSGGVDWRPKDWLNVGMGIAHGASMGTTIPMSAMFSVFHGRWQLGVSTLDIRSLFTDRDPVVSAVFGVARIRL